MVAKIRTFAFMGIEVIPIEVQVQVAPGMPAFSIVGLPDKAVEEARERVRAAVHSLGLSLPARRITINLAPADIAKEGSHFDLPIAIGLLIAMGVLPAAMHAEGEKAGLICPAACGSEAAWAGMSSALAPASLLALINHFKGVQVLSPPGCAMEEEGVNPGRDLSEVRGQETARRALEVAAAGAHNLLMYGPPGAGKSLLASCLPGILPPMDAAEILESSMVASVAGKLAEGRLSRRRPYRDPHHSSSMAAMVGGGRRAAPGEVSLAHHGVLFLDELPEFPRGVLESLRQPLETGTISVARAAAHVTYPARFQLVAAMNPCRCGYLDDAGRACNKAPRCAMDYQGRISGPLLDRIDITIELPEVKTLAMLSTPKGEPSAAVAARVREARARQQSRYRAAGLAIRTNAEADGDMLHQVAAPDAHGVKLLEQAVERLRLSMRSYTRVLRVARTIADLEGAETVGHMHVGEALAYRQLHYARMSEAA
ncbi:MAG: YifB family Mg chelatase-like AAA ATPase [Alphaproteobacteria bacterium]|nr:YifB family Mg chelatase-like AAA ATPase [Alphaproteobacteria bacterium]